MASAAAFNPSEAVTFDLAYGHVHLDGAPSRVLIPADALVELCRAAGPDEVKKLGRAVGEAMGRRVAVRLAGSAGDRSEVVRKAGFEAVITHLAGELALLGMGALSAERWGKALVLIVDQSPLGEAGDDLLGAVLETALESLVSAEARVLCLQRDGVRGRFLVAAPATAERARERLARGENWGSVLASLHRGGKEA
jgi:hypothetical protein